MELLALIAYTFILDVVSVAWSASILNKKIWLAVVCAMIFEPVRILYTLNVVHSLNPFFSMFVVAAVTGIANILTLTLFKKMEGVDIEGETDEVRTVQSSTTHDSEQRRKRRFQA